MPSFGRRVDQTTGGRRRASRETVVLAGALMTLSNSHTVTLVNISSTGARLRGDNLPTRDKDVWLKIGPLDILATVVWRASDLCGVTFDTTLPDHYWSYIRREGKSISLTRLSAEQKLAFEDWQTGLAR